jgi:hypothetical protein
MLLEQCTVIGVAGNLPEEIDGLSDAEIAGRRNRAEVFQAILFRPKKAVRVVIREAGVAGNLTEKINPLALTYGTSGKRAQVRNGIGLGCGQRHDQ